MEQQPQRGSVCAVIVTFNRKQLLQECLAAVLDQTTRVLRVLVVDNASTDGTGEMIRSDFRGSPEVELIRLPTNEGGAGGFHAGFARALASGCEWIWAMDGDGVAERETLERLLSAAGAGDFRSPLVLASEERQSDRAEQLAFPTELQTRGGPIPLRARHDVESHVRDGLLLGYACAFNGVLIRRTLVEQIGLPDKKFFIWGDELDYMQRAARAGSSGSTVLSALYWHPRDRTKRKALRVGPFTYDVPYADDRFRNYLLIRNHGYLAYRYRGAIAWVRHTIKYLLYHRTPTGCFSISQVLRFSLEGLAGRFRGRGSHAAWQER